VLAKSALRLGLARRIAHDRSGNVLILFTLMFFGLALLTGAAIDVSRAVQVRSDLQSAADAAALAGVADFTSLARADHQQAIASDYMSASVLESALNQVDFTVTPFPTKVDGVITAFNIRVAAKGRISTTFLSLLVDAIPVSVESTATIPATADVTAADGDAGMPAVLPAADDPNLFNRPRNLDVEAFGMGIGQARITQ
jgi:Flp pilus assembly protein TadG